MLRGTKERLFQTIFLFTEDKAGDFVVCTEDV